ncbi:hypothetical protein OG937_10650 [Streptomyces sp. NBC_00510]
MSIAVTDPRRNRRILTLAGLALAVLGGIIWLIGDDNNVDAEFRLEQNSSAVWGRVLDFESTQEDEYAAAEEDKSSAETQMTFGIVLGALGLALFGSRWLITPTPAPAKPTATATPLLTPEQQAQAIEMYLEAQKRNKTQK